MQSGLVAALIGEKPRVGLFIGRWDLSHLVGVVTRGRKLPFEGWVELIELVNKSKTITDN